MHDQMDIVVSPDKNYVKYLRVLMISLYENHKGKTINFYILHSDLNEEDEHYIREVSKKYNQQIFMVYVDPEPYRKFTSNNRWPINAFYDLVPHLYLPITLNRALYLDIDTIVDGDITEFYNQNLDDCLILASSEFYDIKKEPENEVFEFEKNLDLDINECKKGRLINSGVLLYNLKAFREHDINLDYYYKKIENLSEVFYDQGTICVALKENIKILKTCKYNYKLEFSTLGYSNNLNNHYHNNFIYDYIAIKPKIIHYCGIVPAYKPWAYWFNMNEINPCDVLGTIKECYEHIGVWWKYAEKSPDYHILYDSMAENKAFYLQLNKWFGGGRHAALCGKFGINSLRLPMGLYNKINTNEDLNYFTKPKSYSCPNGAIKESLKNLPKSFIQKCGFRLTVHTLAQNSGGNTVIVQTIEPEDSNSSIYRRYGKLRGGNSFGEWKKFNLIDDNVDINFNNMNYIIDQINELNAKVKNLESISNSFSYKLGRFITFIPRKLKNLFTKRKPIN